MRQCPSFCTLTDRLVRDVHLEHRHTDRQTDRQTHTHTHTILCVLCSVQLIFRLFKLFGVKCWWQPPRPPGTRGRGISILLQALLVFLQVSAVSKCLKTRYWRYTGSLAFAERALPFLNGVARFWAACWQVWVAGCGAGLLALVIHPPRYKGQDWIGR